MRPVESGKPLVFGAWASEMHGMFNDLSTLADYLKTRRSSRPRNLVAPGPDNEQLKMMVSMAMRTPDHGKLAPWRVIAIGSDQRGALADAMTKAYRAEKPDAGRLEIEALEMMAHHAPALLVVLYTPKVSTKIPEWEQQLSCGAFCMNLLHAIHAGGYVGGWITGWPAYNHQLRDIFGSDADKIAGFIYAGTPESPLEERGRPDTADVLSHWQPSAEN